MGSRAHEYNCATFPNTVVDLVDQQEIAPDMAFPMAAPIGTQGVIPPLGAQRCVIGDDQKHHLL